MLVITIRPCIYGIGYTWTVSDIDSGVMFRINIADTKEEAYEQAKKAYREIKGEDYNEAMPISNDSEN